MAEGQEGGLSDVVLGLVGAGLGALVIHQTSSITVAVSYARISPRLIPFAVGTGLLLLGLAMAAVGLRSWRRSATGDPSFERTDWLSLLIALVALGLHRVLLEPAGFIPSATLLFVAMAWALGSRQLGRDLLCGVAVAVVVWFALGKGLSLQLPMGPLEGLV